MSLENVDQEMLEAFISEMTEILELLDDGLIALEKSPEDGELLNQIFRSVHNIKGASGIMGFEALIRVTHEAENVLNRLRKGDIHLTPEIMDVILEATNLVKLQVGDIKNGELKEREIGETIERLAAINTATAALVVSETETMGEDGPETVATVELPPAESVPVAEPAVTPARSEESVPVTRNVPATVAKPPAPPRPRQLEAKEPLTDNTTVRVDVKRLDDLMDQVGELVLERNRMMQLNQDRQQNRDEQLNFNEEFGKLTKRMSFVTSELQMQVLKMRMIPVGNVFKKFPRIVRSMSRDLQKEVDLQIVGEETELDRSVVDEIGDPLIHLIRNALDHGLESPEERLAAGKTRCGTLVLSALHEGNQIVISIKDDGRGIDTDRVSRKAIEKGLISEEQLAGMSQRDIFDLIFLPGFSTKDVTSDLSGRGVGMDVVKTNIKKLNGLIDIRSDKGRGSEFILRLPLTLAIIQSLLVEVEAEVYCIPLSSVLETLRVDQRQFHTIGGQEVFRLRDRVMPLVRLQRIFQVQQVREHDDICSVVVVGSADKRVGLVVTRLVGQQEVAIKSLGNYLVNIPSIAGSTILGDGRVALIVDPIAMCDFIK